MKHLKRYNVYEASNVEFDANNCQATSYGWWLFVKRIGGKVVFNDYSYSNTTSKHQYKVRSLLNTLGINVDAVIEAPRGLQDLDRSVGYYEMRIEILEEQLKNPKTKEHKNNERRYRIAQYRDKIIEVKRLMAYSNVA